MSDLTNRIKQQQILSGEEAVFENLKKKGLVPHKPTGEGVSRKEALLHEAIEIGICFYNQCEPTEENIELYNRLTRLTGEFNEITSITSDEAKAMLVVFKENLFGKAQ